MSRKKGPPRSAVTVAILTVTLLLVGIMAYQAVDAARTHRSTARDVLRGYAEMAAEQFAQTFEQVAAFGYANPTLYALYQAGADNPDGALTDPQTFRANLAENAADGVEVVAAVATHLFRLDLRTDRLDITGSELPQDARRWTRDTLAYHAANEFDSDLRFAAIVGGGDSVRVLVYRRGFGNRDHIVYGYALSRDDYAQSFAVARGYGGVLPHALTGGVSEDSLLALVVTAANGDTVYATGHGAGELSARHATSPHLGGFDVTAALLPEAADLLIIGGVPESRAPFLLLLFLLTAGMVVTALLLLRREYELARLKSDFVSGVSHELRTPLAQIRMFAETMLLGRVRTDKEAIRSLEIIDQEARRLTQLVENLLHFSRSEQGITKIAPEPVELEPLILDTAEGFSPLAKLKKVKIDTVSEPVRAQVDRSAVQQMLLNLLDNATKYGPEGQTVTVGLKRANDSAIIWVGDEGPGVPTQFRDQIWERFWRQDGAAGSNATGTGIGLAVVKELVTLHGGRAWVESGDRGAKFVISVPAEPGEIEVTS